MTYVHDFKGFFRPPTLQFFKCSRSTRQGQDQTVKPIFCELTNSQYQYKM